MRQLVLSIPSLINLSFLNMTSGLDSKVTIILVLAANGRKNVKEIRHIYQYTPNLFLMCSVKKRLFAQKAWGLLHTPLLLAISLYYNIKDSENSLW